MEAVDSNQRIPAMVQQYVKNALSRCIPGIPRFQPVKMLLHQEPQARLKIQAFPSRQLDELPILFKYPTIAQLIGQNCANGAKQGIRVFLSAQDPNTIMNSVAGAQIMQNMNTRLIGRIQPVAVDSFVKLLFYERSIIARNASEAFFPKRSELYSNWLLDIDGNYTYSRYYPGAVQVGAVANNPDEQAARARVLAQYPDNKLLGMAKFAEQYVATIRNGSSLDAIAQPDQPSSDHLPALKVLSHVA